MQGHHGNSTFGFHFHETRVHLVSGSLKCRWPHGCSSRHSSHNLLQQTTASTAHRHHNVTMMTSSSSSSSSSLSLQTSTSGNVEDFLMAMEHAGFNTSMIAYPGTLRVVSWWEAALKVAIRSIFLTDSRATLALYTFIMYLHTYIQK